MNIKIFDTHCHLQHIQKIDNLMKVLQNAKNCGVSSITCIGLEIGDIDVINKIINTYDDYAIYQSIGIHPLSAKQYTITQIKNYLLDGIKEAKNLVAIGESGLDDFRNPIDDEQIASFALHLKIAEDYNLPLVLHMRSGPNSKVEELCMKMINNKVKIIAHCYGGSREFIDFLLRQNNSSMISFAGNCTYHSAAHLRQLIEYIPINNILVETDAPYLIPEPIYSSLDKKIRSQFNRPEYIVNTLQQIVAIKRCASQQIYDNSLKIFNLFNKE